MRRAILLAACGCGRIGFQPVSSSDANSGSFGPPALLTQINSTSNDIVPSLSADELDLVFATEREGLGHYTLWESTRASVTDPFSPPTKVAVPGSSPGSEPALTEDGLQMIFLANASGLFMTERTSIGAAWSSPVALGSLAGFTNADYIGDLRIVLSDASFDELYEATRTDREAQWAPPQRIDSLATPGVKHNFPTASADGLELIFSTSASGVLQLARARRPVLDAPFGPIEMIDVGFPTVVVGDPELSHDGHTLLFVAENGPSGDYEIYTMTR